MHARDVNIITHTPLPWARFKDGHHKGSKGRRRYRQHRIPRTRQQTGLPKTGGGIMEKNTQLKNIKAIRGLDRQRHFEEGGSLVAWRGGTRTITADRKKKQNKNKCRERVQIPRS